MPKNRRPQSYFVSDSDYKGTTVAERRQMQNTWDLLEQQEIANQIEQERLEVEKEKLQYMKQKDLKENNNDFCKNEEGRKDITRYKKLQICNNIGINYLELERFFYLLEYGNIELLDKIKDVELKIQNSNSEEEIYKLEDEKESFELDNEKFKKDMYAKFIDFRADYYNKKMEDLFKKLDFNIIAKIDEEYEFSAEDSEYFTFEGYKTCSEVFEEIYEDRGTEEDYINFIRKSIASNGKFSKIDIKNEKLCEELNVDYSIIIKFYNSLLNIREIAKEKYDEWHNVRLVEFVKEIEDNQPLIRANKEIQDCYDNGIRILPNILSKYLYLSENGTDDIADYPEDIKEILHNRLKGFKEFRYTHYNEQMELLFKKLELKSIYNLDLLKVREKGTIDDYIKYMKSHTKNMKGDV